MAGVGSYAAQAAIARIGVRAVAAAGAVALALGALLLTGVSTDGGYMTDLFPGLFVFGTGLGVATVAAAIAALGGVAEEEAGVASGTNTAAFQIGGALGAAIASTLVVAHATGSGAAGLTDGLRAGFVGCVVFGLVALGCALTLLRIPRKVEYGVTA